MLTQHIMQQVVEDLILSSELILLLQALIKRKLEEQKENFRRRQGDDTAPVHSQANSSPLSFTPTSVMRKTAADRKDSDPRIQALVPELKVRRWLTKLRLIVHLLN